MNGGKNGRGKNKSERGSRMLTETGAGELGSLTLVLLGIQHLIQFSGYVHWSQHEYVNGIVNSYCSLFKTSLLQAYVYTPVAQSLHYCIHNSHYVRSVVSELKTKMHQHNLVAVMTETLWNVDGEVRIPNHWWRIMQAVVLSVWGQQRFFTWFRKVYQLWQFPSRRRTWAVTYFHQFSTSSRLVDILKLSRCRVVQRHRGYLGYPWQCWEIKEWEGVVQGQDLEKNKLKSYLLFSVTQF